MRAWVVFFSASVLVSPAWSADRGCEPRALRFQDGTFEVSATKYAPASGSGRLVLILPPTGGTTRIDLSYARKFCRQGMAALVIDHWTDDQEYSLELAIHDRFYRRAQRAIDLALAQAPESHIGILGTSVGASHAAIASRRNPRIAAVFLIVGGAPIASILATSDQKILTEGKARRFRLFGFRSTEEYEAALKPFIPFEPLQMIRAGRAPRLGMAISTNDGTVPTTYQQRLREAWHPSVVIESGLGHIATILRIWLCNQNRILDFFREALEE